jgi:hypothetical protein
MERERVQPERCSQVFGLRVPGRFAGKGMRASEGGSR